MLGLGCLLLSLHSGDLAQSLYVQQRYFGPAVVISREGGDKDVAFRGGRSHDGAVPVEEVDQGWGGRVGVVLHLAHQLHLA